MSKLARTIRLKCSHVKTECHQLSLEIQQNYIIPYDMNTNDDFAWYIRWRINMLTGNNLNNTICLFLHNVLTFAYNIVQQKVSLVLYVFTSLLILIFKYHISLANNMSFRTFESISTTLKCMKWTLLLETWNYGLRMRRECRERFPRHRGLATRHASRHVRHARGVMHAGIANKQFLLKLVARENVPGIPGTCASRNFTYLVRGPWG